VTSPSVRPVHKDEIHAVGALVALSFNELDADAYLVPPLADRQRVCGNYFTLYTAHAFDRGRRPVRPHPRLAGAGGLRALARRHD
jgi:hypothetical protein